MVCARLLKVVAEDTAPASLLYPVAVIGGMDRGGRTQSSSWRPVVHRCHPEANTTLESTPLTHEHPARVPYCPQNKVQAPWLGGTCMAWPLTLLSSFLSLSHNELWAPQMHEVLSPL